VRLLLDTHALLWWLERPRRLKPHAYAAIEDPANAVLVSAITVWEIALKSGLRKLRPRADLGREVEQVGFEELPLTWDHALDAGSLPLHHRDPFDRLLIGQARVEGLTIVTRDPAFEAYQVATLPA
jgi:PIN domain nuclease of toxin-antitoxin system